MHQLPPNAAAVVYKLPSFLYVLAPDGLVTVLPNVITMYGDVFAEEMPPFFEVSDAGPVGS